MTLVKSALQGWGGPQNSHGAASGFKCCVRGWCRRSVMYGANSVDGGSMTTVWW